MTETRLRIAHVITDGYLMGGAQLNTLFSLQYLHRDHEVELILGTDGPLGDACRETGIPVFLVPMKNRLLTPLADAQALSGLAAYFRRSRPDIVHTHSSKAGVLGRLAARLASVPVVVHTLHAPSFHDRQPAVVRWLIMRTERALARHTDMIVTVADAMGTEFVQNGICSADRLRTVISGIDLSRISAVPPDARQRIRAAIGIPGDAPVIVSIGHLSKRKNHALLIEAAAAALGVRNDAFFLIVGHGDERRELERQIAALELTGRVILCGLRDDVAEILAASDLFVQTSWLEGVSRSLVEAIYSGLAVIATDVVGTREVVVDGENGYLVAAGDVRALTDRILDLIEDPERRVRMGRVGREMVADKRSIEAMGEGLDKLYRELLERHSRGRGNSSPFAAQENMRF
jgi:glycosyltransferase involved in cell wall biosynthesis